MSTAVLERTKEIGILLAIGWRKMRVVKLVLLESAMYGLFGGITGIILGYTMMRILITMPQIQGFLVMRYDFSFIVKTVGLSLSISILAGIYPAIRAISIDIIEVLRYE
jgi:putative ABC transport system permease protein